MTETDQIITYAVIGTPRRVTLGRRVGPLVPHRPQNRTILRHRFSMLKGKVLRILPRNAGLLVGASALVTFGIAGAIVAGTSTSITVEATAPAISIPVETIASVDQPLLPPPVREPEPTDPPVASTSSGPALPLDAPTEPKPTKVIDVKDLPYTPALAGAPLPIPLPTKMAITAANTAGPVRIDPTAAPPATNKPPAGQTEPEPKALLLDAKSEKAGSRSEAVVPTVAQPPARPVQPKAEVKVSKVEQGVTPSPTTPANPSNALSEAEVRKSESPKPTSGEKVTVVDIGSKGDYVLITNPKTRLPEKYGVGERIHTGEVIKQIDPGKGVVRLDGRSVNLQ